MAKKGALRIHHVMFQVNDLEKTYKFYHDLLGLTDWRTGLSNPKGSDLQESLLKDFNSHPTRAVIEGMELTEVEGGQPTGFGHLAFEVENIDAWIEYLKSHNIPFERIREVTWPQVKMGAKVAFIRDPEGNSVELVEWRKIK